jgi:hypothetical protein
MPLDRILSFLTVIGVEVKPGELPAGTFVPGIRIDRGTLVLDRARLAYPGDLLHEAGHIAVTLPSHRPGLSDNLATGDFQNDMGNEIAAIPWSYAAARHIGIDPAHVFHAAGYRGAAQSYLENFAAGRHVGVPLLQFFGMTREFDEGTGAAVYPCMARWLRPEPAQAD